MPNGNNKNLLERIGCTVSEFVADVAAHPFAQVGLILLCALWWTVGLPTDILTAALSIMAITLTQMVLNRQNEREMDDHRRDVAMHAKLDELISASRKARNEFVAVEELEEEEIVQLKEEVKEAIEEAGPEAGDDRERETAKRAVETVAVKLKQHSRTKNGNGGSANGRNGNGRNGNGRNGNGRKRKAASGR